MARGNAFTNALLDLVFNATPIANIADNAAASPLTNLYVSLHTADPGAAGAQNTSEISYTGYARVAIARTSGGWLVVGGSIAPVNNVVFPASTGGGGTASFFGIGTLASGGGLLLESGSLVPPIVITSGGPAPVFSAASRGAPISF